MKPELLSPKQIEAANHLAKVGFRGIFWWTPGEGKTRLALWCATLASCERVVVIAPKKAIPGWKREVLEVGFTKPIRYVSADSIHKHGIPGEEFAVSMLIVDEIYYFSSLDSQRSKKLRAFSLNFKWRIGLSGTINPAKNNETIWCQLRSINLHRELCDSISEFRNKYRVSSLSPFLVKGRRIKLLNDRPGASQEIAEKIKHITHTHFPSQENRNIKQQIVSCNLSPTQLKAIQQIKKEFLLDLKGETIEYSHTMECIYAICNITNGWIQKENKDLETFPSPKVDELLNILETLNRAGEKAIIWCNFRNDVTYLQSILPFRTLRFWGGEDFEVEKWESGKYPFVLATAASGASVNYFKDVKYAIYFSLPFKLVDFIQSRYRTDRKSSKHGGAFYYYLLANRPAFDLDLFELLKDNELSEKELIAKLQKKFLDASQKF